MRGNGLLAEDSIDTDDKLVDYVMTTWKVGLQKRIDFCVAEDKPMVLSQIYFDWVDP